LGNTTERFVASIENVTVRIDDAWSDPERAAFQAGVEKWNQANNCSSVTFGDYSPIHFTNYTSAPPDWNMIRPIMVVTTTES
jgi:hypothetical protein